MKSLSQHLRANIVAYLALFIALGGTSYAAINLPAGSVGNRQIKNHSITPIKFDPRVIGGSIRQWAEVTAAGRVLSTSSPVHVQHPPTSSDYVLTWSSNFPNGCIVLATLDNEFADGFADASRFGDNGALVTTFNSEGLRQPARVSAAVIC